MNHNLHQQFFLVGLKMKTKEGVFFWNLSSSSRFLLQLWVLLVALEMKEGGRGRLKIFVTLQSCKNKSIAKTCVRLLCLMFELVLVLLLSF